MQKKQEIKSGFTAHTKKRSGHFFFDEIGLANNDELALSYGCQKNLVLPKIPNQEGASCTCIASQSMKLCID